MKLNKLVGKICRYRIELMKPTFFSREEIREGLRETKFDIEKNQGELTLEYLEEELDNVYYEDSRKELKNLIYEVRNYCNG